MAPSRIHSLDGPGSGRRRKCRCESETSAVSEAIASQMQISNKNTVAFEFIIEVAEQAMDAWRSASACRVCDLGGEGNGDGGGEKRSSIFQVFANIAGKLLPLFEAAIHAYPGDTGTGHGAGSFAAQRQPPLPSSPASTTSFICAGTPMYLGHFKLDRHQSYLLARQIIRDSLLKLSSFLQELQDYSSIKDDSHGVDGSVEPIRRRLLALLGRIATETK
ncbi:hypothetical protein O988_03522 [Pseudogymnoascus sp. VKM F-3808]|nr:hypothetical protein O988_03522 [Pseudogymnoascus sp. VKM F-3808]